MKNTKNPKEDAYIRDVIKRGDEGSDLLGELSRQSWDKNYILQYNGRAYIKLPENEQTVVIFQLTGPQEETDPRKYTKKTMERLVQITKENDLTPLAIANVIDSQTGDPPMLKDIMNELLNSGIPVINGENAILGKERMDHPVSLAITCIAKPEGESKNLKEGVFQYNGRAFAVFYHRNQLIFANSDGVGTKTEFYERALELGIRKTKYALHDSLAMKLDDAAKQCIRVMAICDIVEHTENFDTAYLKKHAEHLGVRYDLNYLLQCEVSPKFKGYKQSAPAFNVSGSAVGLIPETQLEKEFVPEAGDFLIALAGEKPSPRSNGITARRKFLIEKYGLDWHSNPEFKERIEILEYLTTPATIFYPLFVYLLKQGTVTAVFHLSGGTYNGKLARPLAKHNFIAVIESLFPLSKEELFFLNQDFSEQNVRNAFAKWPMGAEGFVSTPDLESALEQINMFNRYKTVDKYRAKLAGRIYPPGALLLNPGIGEYPIHFGGS